MSRPKLAISIQIVVNLLCVAPKKQRNSDTLKAFVRRKVFWSQTEE